jgi:hypothetical protein
MFVDMAALALTGHLLVAVADQVPALNMENTCRGAAKAGLSDARGQVNPDEIRARCFAKEREARDDLQRQWSAFAPDHRTSCIRSTSASGIPSYVELLTCLEIADQAAKIPDQPLRGTTGVNGSERR